jgi:citrate synthase
MTSLVGSMQDGVYHLRGTPLPELMQSQDFVSVLWLAWTGKLPSDVERQLIQACLVASVDHGAEPPSANVTRIVASCGKPLADAVAAGLLTLGPRHGNAASAAGEWLQSGIGSRASAVDLVERTLANGTKLSGIGHPVYAVDPRTTALFRLAKQVLLATPHCDLITEVAGELSKKMGKTMPVNVDGAIGAIMCDLSAPVELADALFLVGRTIGLIAHAREEAEQSTKYRRG